MKYKRLSLEKFQKIYHQVPRATVDIIIQTQKGILLTKRAIPPFQGLWHIPGGTILFKEPIKHAIDRVVKEELGISVKIVKHLGIIEYFDDGGRHTIANAYLVEIKAGIPKGSGQGKEIGYFKRIPDNCIPEQKEFLKDYLLKYK